MATLVVFKFPTAEGADTMHYTLEGAACAAVDPDSRWSRCQLASRCE